MFRSNRRWEVLGESTAPELYAPKQLERDGQQFRTQTCSSRSWICPTKARLVNPSIHYKFCRSPAVCGLQPNNTLMVVLFFQPAANSRLKADTLLFVRDLVCSGGKSLTELEPTREPETKRLRWQIPCFSFFLFLKQKMLHDLEVYMKGWWKLLWGLNFTSNPVSVPTYSSEALVPTLNELKCSGGTSASSCLF